MHPIQFAKTTGAHFVAAWLATTMLACDSPQPFDYCQDPACHADAGADGPKRDTPLPPDAPSPDSGMPRNPLCGTTGCFPGNWTACGPATLPAALTMASRAAADASDATDDTIVTADAGADADAPDATSSTDA